MTQGKLIFFLALLGNVLMVVALLCKSAFPADNADSSSFYSTEKGKGYYQYYTDSSPKDSNTDNKTARFLELYPHYSRPVVPSDEELYLMPAKEFKALFADMMEYAVTVRNLDVYSDYMRMQKMASKRTSEFASLQLMYAQLNPPDDNRYSFTERDSIVDETVGNRLKAERQNWGIIYFYSPTCPYCVKMKPIIDRFKAFHGWDIEEIDIGERPAVADAFEVNSTPSLRLVNRDKQVFKLSNGLISQAELEMRTYRYIRLQAGETAPESFAETLEQATKR